jgi:hypothetical protein
MSWKHRVPLCLQRYYLIDAAPTGLRAWHGLCKTCVAMLVPQAMAYAALAELPPITGLYASTLPLFLYALVGRTRPLLASPSSFQSSICHSWTPCLPMPRGKVPARGQRYMLSVRHRLARDLLYRRIGSHANRTEAMVNKRPRRRSNCVDWTARPISGYWIAGPKGGLRQARPRRPHGQGARACGAPRVPIFGLVSQPDKRALVSERAVFLARLRLHFHRRQYGGRSRQR